MKHLNGDKLVSISFKATGDSPSLNGLNEIAFVALHNGRVDKDLYPFVVKFAPYGIKTRRCPIHEEGMELENFVRVFQFWYNKLGLAFNKQIIPVGYDLHELYLYLSDAFGFGEDGELFVKEYFNFKGARDLYTLTSYWNDIASEKDLPYPFQKLRQSYIANRISAYKNPLIKSTCLDKAILQAQVYKNLLDCTAISQVPLNKMSYPSEIDYDYNKEEYHE